MEHFPEPRTHMMTVKVEPSQFKKAKAVADAKGISGVSSLIRVLLRQCIEEYERS